MSAGPQEFVDPEVLEQPEQLLQWILLQAAQRQQSAHAEAERHQLTRELVEQEDLQGWTLNWPHLVTSVVPDWKDSPCCDWLGSEINLYLLMMK